MSAYPANTPQSEPGFAVYGGIPAIVGIIGNTPLLELVHVRDELRDSVRVFAKAEWYNPGGSVKDRAAWFMIRTALDKGYLRGGKRILDATSGNTGIALAMLGSALGIGVTLCLPEDASIERKRLLAAYGAEVILTDPRASTDGAQAVARQMADADPEKYYYANQYANPANVQAHFETTGPEILRQTHGRITHFICGLGTTGTFTGTSRYLKRTRSQVRTWTFQPDGPLHGIDGIQHLPSIRVPEIFDPSLVDGNLEIRTEEALAMLKRLAREEGLLVGISAAAAAAAALKLARTLSFGQVVTVFPDRVDRYLSLPLWDSH